MHLDLICNMKKTLCQGILIFLGLIIPIYASGTIEAGFPIESNGTTYFFSQDYNFTTISGDNEKLVIDSNYSFKLNSNTSTCNVSLIRLHPYSVEWNTTCGEISDINNSVGLFAVNRTLYINGTNNGVKLPAASYINFDSDNLTYQRNFELNWTGHRPIFLESIVLTHPQSTSATWIGGQVLNLISNTGVAFKLVAIGVIAFLLNWIFGMFKGKDDNL